MKTAAPPQACSCGCQRCSGYTLSCRVSAISTNTCMIRDPATVATSEKVFAVFEGPGPSSLTRKMPTVCYSRAQDETHRDLYVAASNDSTLQAGVYDLSVPEHGAGFSGTLDAGFAQAKINPKALTALYAKAGRYVIRLPKPEAYVAAEESGVASGLAIHLMHRRTTLSNFCVISLQGRKS